MKVLFSSPFTPVRVASKGPDSPRPSDPRGFALVATISILVLLAMISVGLLSLSTVAIRGAGLESARAGAQANARLAMMLALGELQKTMGDDRRISADGSIFPDAEQSHAVGVWQSWSPRLAKDLKDGAPDYDGVKRDRFVRWLVSGEETELANLDWVKTAPSGSESVELFGEASDGFTLEASTMALTGGFQNGSIAWAVSQENTKANISVAGPEEGDRVLNDDLQAQPRPNLALSPYYSQPSGNWDLRAAKVMGLNQARLDQELAAAGEATTGRAHFTTTSAGVLANVVDGGLKVDLNLGFEMDEEEFEQERWTSRGESFTNPFLQPAEKDFSVPGSYQNQRPLYGPLSDSGVFEVKKNFWPANVHYHFPVAAVPTFHSLRSFYRIPHHLYETPDGLTVFERPSDHVAGSPDQGRPVQRGFYPPPSKTVDGVDTQMGIRPVMDRVMFLVAGGLSPSDELRVTLTPIVTMWNPYNVALEIEGAVAHTWIDIPYEFTWRTYNASGRPLSTNQMYMSGLMGEQFRGQGHGRSVNPFFYAAITATGNPLPASGAAETIRFEPGEVRVFAPAEQRLTEFNVAGSIRERTLFLRPVDNIDQFSTKGGFSVPTRNVLRNEGFTRKLGKDQLAQITFWAVSNASEDYPFYIALEDATRAKGNDPDLQDRGQAIVDVLANNFSKSDATVQFQSPRVPYARLKSSPVPIGVLESYHRVARSGSDAQFADLVYTGNPRQAWMNPFITGASFKTGPQYQSRMRAVASFNGVLQTAEGGRSAFYGASQNATDGRTHLSFFEVPSAPLLSLAAFQHGDFSNTPFSSANQIGNSWASAYVRRDEVSDGSLSVDHSYLLNESLWDGWFFSGAAPTIDHSNRSASPDIWEDPIANIRQPLSSVLENFFEDPAAHALRNPRMRPARNVSDPDELVKDLLAPEGCLKIAGELLLDGAFNINSTSVEAWTAMLAGLRDATFEVEEQNTSFSGKTPFPRFRDPVGSENDQWHGFRTLDDTEIKSLAKELVEEIQERGPFLSLGEFVNRRITSGDLGLKGALQAAIDNAGLNQSALIEEFATAGYPSSSRSNISPNDTGVGVPGYLTQADVLKPLAPIITPRSDTFTIRSYGDMRDASGKILAKARAEATVQRLPDFVDPDDASYAAIDELGNVNASFGRRFRVVSFRYLTDAEVIDKG